MIIALFKSKFRDDLKGTDEEQAYKQAARSLTAQASAANGFVSADTFTGRSGAVLSVVRFESTETLAEWRNDPEHLAAQKQGRETWYSSYSVEVCELTRAYEFDRASEETGIS